MSQKHRSAGLLVAIGVVLSSNAYSQSALDEVIVTAQKREQSLQEVGISVAAFSGEQIRNLNATSTVDIAQQVPGLQLFTFTPAFTVFGDQALQSLLKDAIANNLDLQVALARIEEARARAGIAKSYYYPQVDAALSAGWRGSSSDKPEGQESVTENANYGFQLSWEIDVFGKLRRQRESALALALSIPRTFLTACPCPNARSSSPSPTPSSSSRSWSRASPSAPSWDARSPPPSPARERRNERRNPDNVLAAMAPPRFVVLFAVSLGCACPEAATHGSWCACVGHP